MADGNFLVRRPGNPLERRRMDRAADVQSPAARGDELLAAFAAADRSVTRVADAGLTEMLPQVYDELRGMAANYLRNERPGHTLQPTALVHETYLRLLGDRAGLQNRAHLLAIAARMMRRILVNYATGRAAQKRGSGVTPIPLDDALEVFDKRETSAVEVNHALEALEKVDSRQAQLVELRFFGGLSVEETAEVLGISCRTVKRDWSVAKLWLKREIARA